jgi:hypothetical protein
MKHLSNNVAWKQLQHFIVLIDKELVTVRLHGLCCHDLHTQFDENLTILFCSYMWVEVTHGQRPLQVLAITPLPADCDIQVNNENTER